MNEAIGSGGSGRNQILSDAAPEAAGAERTASGSALVYAAVTRSRLAIERAERQAEGLRARLAHLELSMAALERGLRALEAGRCPGQTAAGPCARPPGHHTAHATGYDTAREAEIAHAAFISAKPAARAPVEAPPAFDAADYTRPVKGGGR